MPRHDHYGTHDERGPHRGPGRSTEGRARDIQSVSPPDRGRTSVGEGSFGRHSPNYGGGDERVARTSRNGGAAFQGRDYERENYGGGFGTQRKTRDVPDAGRKGEWMHESRTHHDRGRRGTTAWRGQAGGEGLDGLASERAFGSDPDQQMSAMDIDTAYRRWRTAELEAHDEDYRAWRREQARRYDADYARWRARQSPRKG